MALQLELVGERQPLHEISLGSDFQHCACGGGVCSSGRHKQFNLLEVRRKNLLQLHIVAHRPAVDVDFDIALADYADGVVLHLDHW